MSADRFQVCALLLLSGLLCVTSMGFAAPEAADSPSPEQLVLEAVESTNNESIQGVRTEVFQRADQFEMVTVEVTEAPPTRTRIEVIDTIQADGQSDLTVINGSTRWQYYQEQQQAIQTRTASPLQRSTQFGPDTDQLLNEYVVEYEGTETVEDRQTHVVELTPPKPRNVELSLDIQTGNSEYEFQLQDASRGQWYVTEQTWWIDTETSYPVKKRIEWTDQNGETIATTIQKYHELTVGADIDEDAFGFEPPEGVNVTRPTLPEFDRYRSREAAASHAGFELPSPDVPAGYELHEAFVQEFETAETGVLLTYVADTETLTVQVSEQSVRSGGERVVKRNVGAVDGTLVSMDGRPTLTWECDGLSHRVSGLQSADGLIDVAESIGCQTTADSDDGDDGTTVSGGSPVAPELRATP
jgi:outer membrane lipoprotein-sorting protein